MPDNFVPGPAKRERKEKTPDKTESVKPPKPPAPAKPKQTILNIFESANRQPAHKATPPPIPKTPPGMDKGAMDAIRRQVETMRAAKKGAQNGSAAPKKPPPRQEQLPTPQAPELQRAASDWASAVHSEMPAEEDPADFDDDPDSEWVTVVGRKKGKAPAKAPAVAPQPPAGMSKKQAKRQAYLAKRAAQEAMAKPAPKAEAKPAARAPAATSPAPLVNAWAKPDQEQQQVSYGKHGGSSPLC